MTRTKLFFILLTAAILGMSACSQKSAEAPDAEQVSEAPITLESVINHNRRITDQARDQYRNPKQTLEFFEVGPGKHVVEIWPGWYTKILAPYLAANDGTYTAVLYSETERSAARLQAFRDSVSDTGVFGQCSSAC